MKLSDTLPKRLDKLFINNIHHSKNHTMKHILILTVFGLLANLSFAVTKPRTLESSATEKADLIFHKEFTGSITRKSSDMKNAVQVATIENVALYGTQTIDGVALIAEDRILVKNQADQTQNGIYVIKSETWIRATDMDEAAEIQNSIVQVISGTVNNYTSWTCLVNNIVLGTTQITFVKVIGDDSSGPSVE